ncbi:MAG: hypothetical protein HY788_19435 [Deltaproteobacteria bacterium]|nr:hypothetical protein [Deltaproteobacteria bacterium]
MKCMMPKFSSLLPVTILALPLLFLSSMSNGAGEKSGDRASAEDGAAIYRLAPDSRGGQAYKLVYLVRAPLDVFWKFKTDFDNDFLVTNKYIREHRFISRSGDSVITEDEYTHVPRIVFRWKTTVHSAIHRLDFVLMNPEECDQKYHYGYIRIESVQGSTRVTQVAYFDFRGASIWAVYPWGGGMKDFLSYTARWEQETVLRLTDRYSGREFKGKTDDEQTPPLNR